MRVLAGDVGGTNTRLALYEVRGESLERVSDHTFPSGAYSGLEPIVRELLGQVGNTCDAACFGLAGPVRERRVRLTNLPWEVDADQLERALGISPVTLVNDLEAVAWAVGALGPQQLERISRCAVGRPGNAAVIAAGTGLGEAGLFWDGVRHRPFGCEGSHADFAPSSELEVELLRWLWRRHERVSWERVVSGPGLVSLYRFLCEHHGAPLPGWLSGGEGDDPATVTGAALAGQDPIAREAVGLFVRLYGAEAGNLALKLMPRAGVYLAGGIAPRLLPALRDGGFMEAFLAKGRMRPLLEEMPVRVILDDRVGLLGAARCATSR